jgi:hypothetical protein
MITPRRHHILTILLVLFLTAPMVRALAAPPNRTMIRLYLPVDKSVLQEFALGAYDILKSSPREGTLDMLVNHVELQQLMDQGFTFDVLMTPPELANVLIDPQFLNPDEVASMLQDYADNYPEIVQLINCGTSHEGRTIWAVKISDNVELEEDEFTHFIVGCHHAREVMTPEIPMDIIDYLTSNYGTDPQVTEWVNEKEIYVMPMLNPDGNMYVWTTDPWWRKNRRNNGGSYGVDLNRNYPFDWGNCGGSSNYPGSETYRGPSPGSEPEIQALIGLAEGKHFVTSISYHSYSELVIYPYGCPPYVAEPGCSDTGQQMASLIMRDSGQMGYSPGTAWQLLYDVDGDDIGWHYGQNGTIAYVVEVNQEFQPPYSYRDPTVEHNRPGWMYILNRLTQGPSIIGHVYDACTGEPLEATLNLAEVQFNYNEAPRTSHPTFGRYHWIVVPGTYHLTASKTGYGDTTIEVTVGNAPVERNIYMVPSQERAVFVASVTIDDSTGDNDGTLDPGEEAALIVTAAAPGLGVSGLVGQITTNDPYLTIIDDQAEFQDIIGGGSGETLPPHFTLAANPATPR